MSGTSTCGKSWDQRPSSGVDTAEARRILVPISDIAFADVLDADLVARHHTHPQFPDLLHAVEEASFPHLRRVLGHAQRHPHDHEQFEFHLQAFLAGLERGLPSVLVRRSPGPKR